MRTEDELALAHDPAYVASVRALASRAAAGWTPTPWRARVVGRRHGGRRLRARRRGPRARRARRRAAFAPFARPATTRFGDSAMGFCLFGNVAIAAHYARRVKRLDRVLIVDWDVHHGNGTQALVEDDANIRFVSMHQWPWYPGTGAADDRGPNRSVWNVPLPPALPRERPTSANCSRRWIEPPRAFTPDLVLISAGSIRSPATRSAASLSKWTTSRG